MALTMKSRVSSIRSTRSVCPSVSVPTVRAPSVRVQVYREPSFVADVKRNFPNKGVASVEEARALIDLGYIYVDVRPLAESEDQGKVRNVAQVPFMNAKPIIENGKRVLQKTPNADFVKQFKNRFPKLDQKLLISCSNGKDYSIGALLALEAAGYTNLTGLKGGYLAFSKTFDNTLKKKAGALAVARH